MGKTKLGNYAKFMSNADTSGLPLAVHKASARAHEVALAQVPSIKLSPWEDSGELLGIMPMPVIRWITRLHNKGLSLLRPIGENEDVPPLRSVALCTATDVIGKSRVFFHGSTLKENYDTLETLS